VRRPWRSSEPSLRRSRNRDCDRNSLSSLFEPEASQLASDAQAAAILGEDNDKEEVLDAGDDSDNEDEDPAVRYALDAAGAVDEVSAAAAVPEGLPDVAITAMLAQSSGQQRPKLQNEEIEEELHLYFRWRACWGTTERGAIATAACAKRNRPLYSISEEKLWQWAGEVVEQQKPRAAEISSLTATLYYTNSCQAKADRCTLALQRRCIVAGEGVKRGNWHELQLLVEDMNKESSELLKCDFDLVLRTRSRFFS
jgi:hypothetical protein